MPSISEALGASAAPYEVQLNERTVKLGLITQGVKAGLEKWLFLRAIQDAADTRSIVGEASFDRQLSDIRAQKEEGKFGWGGESMVKATGTLAGIAKTISLLSIDPATKAAVSADEIEDVLFKDEGKILMTLFQTIFADSMPAKKKPEPNQSQAPEPATSPVQSEPSPQ